MSCHKNVFPLTLFKEYISALRDTDKSELCRVTVKCCVVANLIDDIIFDFFFTAIHAVLVVFRKPNETLAMSNDVRKFWEQVQAYTSLFGNDAGPLKQEIGELFGQYPHSRDHVRRQTSLCFKNLLDVFYGAFVDASYNSGPARPCLFPNARWTSSGLNLPVVYGVTTCAANLYAHAVEKSPDQVRACKKTLSQYEMKSLPLLTSLLKDIVAYAKQHGCQPSLDEYSRVFTTVNDELLLTEARDLLLLHPKSIGTRYLLLVEYLENQASFDSTACFVVLSDVLGFKIFGLADKETITTAERKHLQVRTKGRFREPSTLEIFKTMQSEITLQSIQRLIYGDGPAAVNITVEQSDIREIFFEIFGVRLRARKIISSGFGNEFRAESAQESQSAQCLQSQHSSSVREILPMTKKPTITTQKSVHSPSCIKKEDVANGKGTFVSETSGNQSIRVNSVKKFDLKRLVSPRL